MAPRKVYICAECGSDALPHLVTYITVALDEGLKPLFAPGPLSRSLMRFFYSVEHWLSPYIFRALIKIGWATTIDAPDDDTLLLAKVLWEEAETRGIAMQEIRLFGLARNIFIARYPNGHRVVFEGIPLPGASLNQAWWIDNKAEMKKHFHKLGIPVPLGGAAMTEEGAKRIYKTLTPPVILKPYSGSASRHTTLHVKDETCLLHAFRVALQVAPLSIIEEELVGPVFRATVVDGKLIGVIRRDPPHVIGDGTHTVTELIETANTHPARSGPYFSKMSITPEAVEELSWQNLTPESIPESGRRVTLHQKINWSLGGTTADVTDATHPDNAELFERVAHVLKAPVVGLDFIIGDMAVSWKEQVRCGVIECNSMPYFDNHHLPFEGKPRNVAGAIWDMVSPSPR